MPAVATSIRINDNLRSAALPLLDSIGLSLSSYVNMALSQLCRQGKIPFECYASDDIPNDLTRRAMIEAQAKAEGVIPDGSPRSTDIDILVDSLLVD